MSNHQQQFIDSSATGDASDTGKIPWTAEWQDRIAGWEGSIEVHTEWRLKSEKKLKVVV